MTPKTHRVIEYVVCPRCQVRVVVLSSAILNEHAKSAAAPVRSSCGRRSRGRRLTKGIYSGYPRLYLVRWREIVSPPWKGDPRLVAVIFDRQQSAYVCVEVSNDAITEKLKPRPSRNCG
jgi:hypothetical protein